MKNIKDFKSFDSIAKWASVSFTALMFSLFPVFLTDGYFNIRHDKLNLFYSLASVLLVLSAVAFILFYKKDSTVRIDKSRIKDNFSLTDAAVALFILTAAISTIFSPYRAAALTGLQGRNNGLILLLYYGAVYFLISRKYRSSRLVMLIFCITSAGVAVLAVLNQFYWDPFNIYAELSTDQYNKFISTIGNRNMLSAFMCLSFPFCFSLFIHSDNNWDRLITAVCTSLNFCGLICSNSDGSILGAVLFLIAALIINITDVKRLSMFCFMTGVMITACKLCRLVSLTNDDYSMGFSSIQNAFVYGNAYVFGVAMLGLSGIFYFVYMRKTKVFPKSVRITAIFFLCVVILYILFAVWHYSVDDTSSRLSGLYKYLRFNDSWGTHRGFMWIRSVYAFFDMNVFQRLFGSGPDTYRLVMDAFGYTEELKQFKHETTDAAHNAYLNYLVTLGAFGLVSYLTIIASTLKRALSLAKDKYVFAFTAAVFCYSIQATVNIEQPITTPLLILMLALAENGIRTAKIRSTNDGNNVG